MAARALRGGGAGAGAGSEAGDAASVTGEPGSADDAAAGPAVGEAVAVGDAAADPAEVPAGSATGQRTEHEAGRPAGGGDPADADGPVEIAVTSRARAWRGMAALVLREWAVVLGLLGVAAAIVTFVQRVLAGGLTPGESLTILLLAPLAYALLLAIGGGVVVAAVVVAVLAPAGLRLGRGGFVAAAVGAWALGALVTLLFFGTATVPLLATALGALLHVGTLLWRFRQQDRQDREAAVAATATG